tara:strand:- start:205 stop:609 length:405 start_codon:yes stop_codon:yes gene_type:complete
MNKCYHNCHKQCDDIYCEKIPLCNLTDILNKFILSKIGQCKEYWINNVQIISYKNNLTFSYINDLSIDYKDNFIIQTFTKNECKPFNFFHTDLNDEFILYENKEKNIQLKEYKNYLTFQVFNINDDNLIYYNIL